MPADRSAPVSPSELLLAVYAPFGTDEVLSTFPDGSSLTLLQHPLVQALREVAATGVQVVALVDRVNDDSWFIEIPAGQPGGLTCTSRWKLDMAQARTLSGFLVEAHQRAPKAQLVLALEGHGAGYLPEVDGRRLDWRSVTEGGKFEWHFSERDAAPVDGGGNPVLPMGYPGLPMGYPGLPTNHRFLSTWGLGQALAAAVKQGVPRPLVIHFDNCFNMSVEVLHTVAPYAEQATGYNNYNFFTSGASYPAVFQRLKAQGQASAAELAQWFADENHALLAAKGGHPIVAGVVELARMEGIAQGIDELSDALLDALRSASPAARPGVVALIQDAIVKAQQYDSEPGWELETPDQLTDIQSLAAALAAAAGSGQPAIRASAEALVKLLDGIKRVGDVGVPWLDESGSIVWDFSEKTLAMNIFLPDPQRSGQWDWRSTYYVDVNPDPSKPLVQPGVIEFLKATNWVDFLVEYHRDVPFKAFHLGAIPRLPAAQGKSPQAPGGRTDGTPLPSPKPKRPWPLGRIGVRLWARWGHGGTQG